MQFQADSLLCQPVLIFFHQTILSHVGNLVISLFDVMSINGTENNTVGAVFCWAPRCGNLTTANWGVGE